ncbi:hypothetical protein AYK26_03025 [Euryarchaeota archaeon SM23-78]|nr:MAG: hypothetical protein AYK26_03025 [Euryarchaeota archaeon SM23-78]MBW3000417.1 DUF4202 domain-containing protein [Candidatus Woesearchaeota archaeon]
MKDLIKKAEAFFRNNLPKTRPPSVYTPHVELVRKYALILGKEYNADLLVLEVAALLHDIGADAGDVHAFKSAEIAGKFLSEQGIDEDTKEKIISAIRNHSMIQKGEEFKEGVNIADQVLRDADGIAFLEDTFKGYLEIKLRKYGKDKAKQISLVKIKGMLKKVKTEKGKELANKFYPIAKEYISNF